MKKIIIILLVALVVGFGFFSIKMSKSKITENLPPVPISQTSKIEVAPPISTSNNLKNNTLITYTSKNLGVSFTYPKIDPYLKENITGFNEENKVIEKDNIITIQPSGGSITVFKKDPSVSFEKTLKQIMPDCRIVISKINLEKTKFYSPYMGMVARIYFPDGHIWGQEDKPPIDFQVGHAGDVVETEENKKCAAEVTKFAQYNAYYYLTESDSSDKFIGVPGVQQAVEAVLSWDKNNGSITTWMSTVKFVK